MELVYVAGPYRAKTLLGVILNILKARRISKILWSKGYAVICPHSNSALFNGLPDSVWLDGDIEMLKRCDMIVLTPGWKKSSGTLNEIWVANKLGIPVYAIDTVTTELFLIPIILDLA